MAKLLVNVTSSPGRMPRVSPVAGFQQYGMKHSELDYFPGLLR